MDKGVLLFAYNNEIDYVKQAIYCAEHIKKHLDLPIALVTNQDVDNSFIDIVIQDNQNIQQSKTFYDGPYRTKRLNWNNASRSDCYDLSPFDKTIVMDTDVILGNNDLSKCFDLQDLQISKNHVDALSTRKPMYKISDTSLDMYWATVFYFKKTSATKMFFDLVKHIKENYLHYRNMYQFKNTMYRNDFAFSIAIHIMNGFQKGGFATELPGNNLFSLDKDVLVDIDEDELQILVEKENRLGEYTGVKVSGSNIHIMNKFSLERVIDGN